MGGFCVYQCTGAAPALSGLTSPPSYPLSANDQRLFFHYLGHLGEGDDSRHHSESYKGAVSNEY
jgi:hypothetical protein